MNESKAFVNMQEESAPCLGRPRLDGTQRTFVTQDDGAPSSSLTGGQPTMAGTTINHNTNQQGQTNDSLNVRVSPITCVKQLEKENTSLDDNRNESSNNSQEASPFSAFSREPFSLPPGYPMYQSLMHEFGVEPSIGQVIHGSQAEQGTIPGLGAHAVEKKVDEKPKACMKVLPTRQVRQGPTRKPNVPRNNGIIPTDVDVLCGRGPSAYVHPGNRTFHRIKHKLQDAYLAANKSNGSKAAISQELVDQIHHRGGRFLKKEDGVWLEISNQCARDRAAQVLRTAHFTTQERSARRTYFRTEKEISSKQKSLSDLTQEEVAARALFEKVRDRQQEGKKSTIKK